MSSNKSSIILRVEAEQKRIKGEIAFFERTIKLHKSKLKINSAFLEEVALIRGL